MRATFTGYNGTAGDSLAYHNGMNFSSKDIDNDHYRKGSCSLVRGDGGWWFDKCSNSNLNGRYLGADARDKNGITWYQAYSDETRSFKMAQMKIRPT